MKPEDLFIHSEKSQKNAWSFSDSQTSFFNLNLNIIWFVVLFIIHYQFIKK
jgi:hypothetical protein